jgi:putative tricarboxylic transport membrane protein
MLIKKNKNLVAGGFLFAMGLIYFLLSFTIQLTNIDKLVGSRLFPQIIGVLIMFFSAWMMVDNLLKNKKGEKVTQINEDGEVVTDDKPKPLYKNTVLVLVSLAAYIILMGKIGFLVSTLIYLISQMALLEKEKENRNYLKYFIVSLGASVAIYFLFTTVFNMVLPRGILF